MSNETVLLINFGGPRSETEIPSFLRRLMGREPSPAIRDSAINRYRAIGGLSPLPAATDRLSDLLASRLGSEITVRAAFMYSDPTIGDAIMECRARGSEKIVFVLLSPFYSRRVVGAYIRSAEDHLARSGAYNPVTIFVHSWCTEPLFVDWWVTKVRKAVESVPSAFVLFSAHNLPSGGSEDLYRSQIENTVRLVAERTGLTSYALAWQSTPPHSDEEFLAPSVEQVLDSLPKRGVSQVVQVPIGFIMDHLETSYDVDILHRQYAHSLGIDHQRVDCPNTDPLFVDLLWKLVSERLKEPM
jgi:protoporphyrin/coproporphyrin ferrochelatase